MYLAIHPIRQPRFHAAIAAGVGRPLWVLCGSVGYTTSAFAFIYASSTASDLGAMCLYCVAVLLPTSASPPQPLRPAVCAVPHGRVAYLRHTTATTTGFGGNYHRYAGHFLRHLQNAVGNCRQRRHSHHRHLLILPGVLYHTLDAQPLHTLPCAAVQAACRQSGINFDVIRAYLSIFDALFDIFVCCLNICLYLMRCSIFYALFKYLMH
jgi:hypothetical protein